TELYGPPEVRRRKNQEYVAELVATHTEPVVRGILKALAKLPSPQCAANLSERDLDSVALDEIIRPHEHFGLNLSIETVGGEEFTVKMGEFWNKCGSGGGFILERSDDGSFRVKEVLYERLG